VVDIQLDEPLSEDPGKHPHYYNRVFVTWASCQFFEILYTEIMLSENKGALLFFPNLYFF
jgi:hypothetical protein